MLAQTRQASFVGEDCCNGPVESCLVGLLAGPVVVLPYLTGAILARYNPGQDVYSPGKPAIYSKLATDKYGPWNRSWYGIVSSKARSGQV